MGKSNHKPPKKRFRTKTEEMSLKQASSQSNSKFECSDTGEDNNNNGRQGQGTPVAQDNDNSALSGIQVSLDQLILQVDRIEKRQEKLDQDISGNEGLKQELHGVAKDTGENSSSLTIQSNEIKDLRKEMDLLKALVIKQGQQLAHLQAENDDLKNRSMRNNVIFHNLHELSGSNETPEDTVKRFLQNTKMPGIESLVFERVHRLGTFQANAKYPRPIVARLLSSKDTERVLSHGRTLRKGDDQVPRITPQFSAGLREKRKTLGAIATDVKSKATDVTTKISKDKLYINNDLYHEAVLTPTPAEILNMTDEDEREVLNGPKLVHGDTLSLGGHNFTATAAEVKSIADVRLAYKKLLLSPNCMGAAHNTCAYTLYDANTGKSTTGHQDDGEHGVGRLISSVLCKRNAKNVVVFVTRRFLTRAHLGIARFKTIEEAAVSALNKLDDESYW